MLAVILSEDDRFFQNLAALPALKRHSIVRYRDPVKLADNLQELSPDSVFIRGADFPLHWMELLAQLEYSAAPSELKFYLFGQGASPETVPKVFNRFIYIQETQDFEALDNALSHKPKTKKGLMAAAELAVSSVRVAAKDLH
jgi:hypothetical protein